MTVLVLGAHPDDIEFAMGGTLARLKQEGKNVTVAVMSKSLHIAQNADIMSELDQSMEVFGLEKDCYQVFDFDTRRFEQQSAEIRDAIFRLKQAVKPDTVFCTSPHALHPDHATLGRACKSVFQETSIYAYEDIRGNHDMMINYWYRLTEAHIKTKIEALSCYRSQNSRTYFDMEQIRAVAMARGIQVGARYAEGFEALRVVS